MCVEGLGRALKERGIKLSQPNKTCDVVYCYCEVRLHPLTCPEAFHLGPDGRLRGNENVKRLGSECFNGGSTSSWHMSSSSHRLSGYNKCLNSLHALTQKISDVSSKSGDRTTKMHIKDCHLMRLTWLLAKNGTAYIHTVIGVLRATMLRPDGSILRSCTLGSHRLPLAVDSSEISGCSSQLSRLQLSRINVLAMFSIHKGSTIEEHESGHGLSRGRRIVGLKLRFNGPVLELKALNMDSIQPTVDPIHRRRGSKKVFE
ncbi:hypothetical protein SAY87_003601 [Trapa incisa]|uniref:Uncharacterized protein n=1 Tax=Trapa incisa TaxID=236973 RepID=A0AAN7KRN5_9MYRT|nr:hypothetical protein SAY87_003601 [Trapa incisa]